MRRTRHVVLPVRSWQYIGLLIVSLACLTLGLVSRDREGHAGSLAGPELTHRAPHEVDACPNLNPFVKSPIVKSEQVITKSINNHEMKVSEFTASFTSQKPILSRSLSLNRLSRTGLQETRERLSRNRDVRTIERLSKLRTRISDDESIKRYRESRFRTIAQFREARSSFDPATQLSRSRDLFSRATGRRSAEQNFEQRLTNPANSRLENRRFTERRELSEIARRQNRVDRSADLLNFQRRTSNYRDRQSFATERRIDRQESREDLADHREYLARNRVPRSEIRGRRSVERRMSIEHRDAERSDYHEDRRNLLKRSARFAQGDIDRNNNMDRRNHERYLENRRTFLDRVANQERSSRFSVATRNSRENIVKSDRRTLSRSMERPGDNDLNRKALSRRVRSVESNAEGFEERRSSFERRSLVRSMERHEMDHAERRKMENHFGDRKSLERVSRVSSEDLRRERITRLQRTASKRDSRENTAIRETHRMARYDFEEIGNRERKERFARSSHSIDRQEIARIKDSRDYSHRSRDSATAERRDSTQERREKTTRLYQLRQKQKIVLQRSREAERRTSERGVPEKRVLERRVILDSARLDSRLSRSPEQRIDDSLKSRENSRLDRRLERNPESQISRGRILERRSNLDFRRSSERRINEGPKIREEFRLTDRRSERSLEARISRERILERRSALDSQKSSERRIYDISRSRKGFRLQNQHFVEWNSELRNSISMLPMERRANSRTASLENQVLRSSETQREIRRLTERRVVRSIENRVSEPIRHLHQRSVRNIEDSSRLLSLRRVVRVPEQNREQRRLSTERILDRIVDSERLFVKRNLQDAHVERNSETRAKIVFNSMKDYEFFKYSMAYDLIKQAFVVALCTIYGLSLYNGKKSSLGSSIMQHTQRFVIW